RIRGGRPLRIVGRARRGRALLAAAAGGGSGGPGAGARGEVARQPVQDQLPAVAAVLRRRVRGHDGGGHHLGPPRRALRRGPRRRRAARVRDGPLLPRVPRGVLDLFHLRGALRRARRVERRGRSRAGRGALRRVLERGTLRGVRRRGDAQPPSRHRAAQAGLPPARARRGNAPAPRAQAGLRSTGSHEPRKAPAMNGLREDLSATGSAVLAEGEGLRVTPPSIAALGRAVAVLRGHGLPVRVRGNGDAPVEAPKGGALLELTGLDRIASVDGATGIARVEAGCSVAALETAARRAGGTLGPLLPSVRAGPGGAWLAAPVAFASWQLGDLRAALEAVKQLCLDRLAPARGMLRAREGGALLALSWEGPETARLQRGRAARSLGEPLELDAGPEVRAPPSAQAIEVDAPWEALSSFAGREDAAEMAMYGMHAGGAFAALSLAHEGADHCAAAARSAAARGGAPRGFGGAGPGGEAEGAGRGRKR